MNKLSIEIEYEDDNKVPMVRVLLNGEPLGLIQKLKFKAASKNLFPQLDIELSHWPSSENIIHKLKQIIWANVKTNGHENHVYGPIKMIQKDGYIPFYIRPTLNYHESYLIVFDFQTEKWMPVYGSGFYLTIQDAIAYMDNKLRNDGCLLIDDEDEWHKHKLLI